MKNALFILIICLIPSFGLTQESVIKGKIIGKEENKPLENVSISVADQRTNTNEKGEFELRIKLVGEIIITIDLIGFEKQEILKTIQSGESIDMGNIILIPSIIQISEVVISISEYNFSSKYNGSNTTINQKELITSQPIGSEEALKKVAGINVSGDMGISNRLNVGIRGSYPRRSGNILLLEDGSPIAPAPYLAPEAYYNPPSDRLDGIEIIKGADLLTLGSNTAYGAINYITKKPPLKPTTGINLTEGTNGYHSRYITYGGTWNNVGAEIQILQKQFGGFQDNSHSSIFNTTAKIYADLGKRSSFYFKINYHQENSKASYSSLTPFSYKIDPKQNPFDADDLTSKRYATDLVHNYKITNNIILTSKVYASQFLRDWWRQENTLVKASSVKSYLGDDIYADRYSYLDGQTFTNDDYVRVGKITSGKESTKARNRLFRVGGIQETLKINYLLGKLHGKLEIAAKAHVETFSNIELKNDSSRFSRSGTLSLNEYYTMSALSGYIKNNFEYNKFSITPIMRYEVITMRQFDLMKISTDKNNDGTKYYGSLKNEFSTFLPGTTIGYKLISTEKNNIDFYAGIYKGYTAPISSVGFLNVDDGVVGAANTTTNPINMLPETSLNYEAGFRGDLLNNFVNGQFTYFNNHIQNFYSAGRNEAFEALGEVKINGLEAAVNLNLHSLFKTVNHKISLGVSATVMNSIIVSGRLRDTDLLKEKHTDLTKQEVIDKINTERNGYDVYVASSTGTDSLITRELVLSDFSSIKRIDLIFGENGIKNNQAPYVPKTLFNISLSYAYKGISISGNINYVSSQFTDYLNLRNETAEGATGELVAYKTIDANLAYSFTSSKNKNIKGLTMFIACKNLTDEVYKASRLHRVSSGIMPGGFRQVNGGIRYSF